MKRVTTGVRVTELHCRCIQIYWKEGRKKEEGRKAHVKDIEWEEEEEEEEGRRIKEVLEVKM